MTKRNSVKDTSAFRTRKYDVGSIIKTKYGDVKILEIIKGYTDSAGKRFRTRCVCIFLATGYVTNCQLSNLTVGKVKDMRMPTVYGVGYIGSDIKITARGTYVRRLYDLWANMLKRCYFKSGTRNDEIYKDVKVDTRWHSFTNFMNTIQDVEGFELFEAGLDVALDKDIKVKGNKVYSRDTCMFVSTKDNTIAALNKRWHGK